VTWCDRAVASPSCVSGLQLFPPCISSKTGCSEDLDTALDQADMGSLLYVSNFTYLMVPSKADDIFNERAVTLQFIMVSPDGLDTRLGVQTPLPYAHAEKISKVPIISKESKALLGTWTRRDVFSTSALNMQRRIRSSTLTNTSYAPVRWFEASQLTQATSQWLAEVRLSRKATGWALELKNSMSAAAGGVLVANCTPNSCAGCSTARLRLTCAAAQVS
jgi:hypothetical protein